MCPRQSGAKTDTTWPLVAALLRRPDALLQGEDGDIKVTLPSSKTNVQIKGSIKEDAAPRSSGEEIKAWRCCFRSQTQLLLLLDGFELRHQLGELLNLAEGNK